MKKLTDLPPEDRPRERLLEKGARALADYELVAILLGKGTHKHDVFSISRRLIKIIDQKGVNLGPGDILKVEGIGSAKATLIAAALEFVRRRIKPEGLKIKFPADVLPLIRHYADRKQEHFICVSINGANEMINVRVISIGLINRTHVHPREVFADVIAERASAVIIAHNHPVGDLTPSKEDSEITIKIKAAGEVLGIKVLDHIIFNRENYFSFMENDEL